MLTEETNSFFKIVPKDRMFHFNFSVAVKRRRNSSLIFKIFQNYLRVSICLSNFLREVTKNVLNRNTKLFLRMPLTF